MYKYQEISSFFSQAIAKGEFIVGQKLPSIREVQKQFTCSLSVAVQAFEELEQNGTVRSVPKSGFYVNEPVEAPLPTPQNYSFSLNFRKTKANTLTSRIIDTAIRPDFVSLGGVIPDLSILPAAKLKESMRRVLTEKEESLRLYTPSMGELELRQEIVKFMKRRGVVVSENEVLITNGCIEALALAIRSCTKRGDVIAIESPVWFGLPNLLEELGLGVVEIPVHAETGLDLEYLEQACEENPITACVMTANFQNPMGFVMPEERKEQLLELSSVYDFALIEDDIYGDCAFDGKVYQPLKALDHTGQVMYCSSFSKTISPGFRIGWLLAGQRRDQCRNIKVSESFGGAAPMQLAMADFLSTGAYERHIRMFRKKIAEMNVALRSLIIRYFPTGTKVSSPKGGFFLWIEYPGTKNAKDVFEAAVEGKISIAPGIIFSVGPRFKNCIRLNSGIPIDERVEVAIKRLGALICKS